MATNTIDELLELEHAGWASLSDGTGHHFYGETMSEDGLMVLANGMVMDRVGVVDALRQAPPWTRYRMDDVRLVDMGPDAAALVYTGRGWREGSDEPFIGAMSLVYRRTEDGWKLALYQQTPVVLP